jgi:MFS family permease
MLQLIAARAVQGLGAGGIIPLTMTIIGELYSLSERPRTQALFSGVWGTASVLGPLVGGYITDALSWRWVFYINLPFGLLCVAVIATAYPPSRGSSPVRVDWLGAALLFSCVSALLIALGAEERIAAWAAVALALFVAFVMVERRQAEPILPVDLLSHRVISRTLMVVFLVGVALFGAIAFVPLFVQSVMGGTATQAGQVLTPLFLGWVTMSVIGAKITVRIGYRLVAIAGSVLMTLGFIGLTRLDVNSGNLLLLGSCLVLGAGMGCQMLSLLLAVQHGVERSRLGIATSLNQFARSIGAAIGVAAMGAIMSRSIADLALPGEGNMAAAATMSLSPELRAHFAVALHRVFVAGAMVSAAGLCASIFLPHLAFNGVPAMAGQQLIEAEMASLDSKSEPIIVE